MGETEGLLLVQEVELTLPTADKEKQRDDSRKGPTGSLVVLPGVC